MLTTYRYTRRFFWVGVLWVLTCIFFSCRSRDRQPGEAPLGNLFFHYDIQASDEWDDVTVKVQFRLEHVNGPVVRPSGITEILLDGRPLQAGDSRYTGPYYEIQWPRDAFTGVHVIEIKSSAGTESRDSFYFQPLTLVDWPDTLRRGTDLRLQLSGLGRRDMVQVLITDTSFSHDGVERQLRTREDGLVMLPAATLEPLSPGPLRLMLTREFEDRITREKGPGGALTLQYQLQREGLLAE